MSKPNLCPCYSGKPYANCCQKYHQGGVPENALALMRSRYAAYALGLAEYLIATTHPMSPHFVENKKQWASQIKAFSQQVSFQGLEILETELSDSESFVSFVAVLGKDDSDLTFSERSRFIKEGQMWKYVEGKIGKGRLSAGQLKKSQRESLI